MAQQEWTNNQNLNSALKIDPTFKLSGSGDYVYYYKISMSNDYSGDEANLYQTFTGDIKDIVKTFKLK